MLQWLFCNFDLNWKCFLEKKRKKKKKKKKEKKKTKCVLLWFFYFFKLQKNLPQWFLKFSDFHQHENFETTKILVCSNFGTTKILACSNFGTTKIVAAIILEPRKFLLAIIFKLTWLIHTTIIDVWKFLPR